MRNLTVAIEKMLDMVLFLIFSSAVITFPVVQQRQFLFIGLQVFLCALAFGRRSSRSARLERARGAIISGYVLVIYLWNLFGQAGYPGSRALLRGWPPIFWLVSAGFIFWLVKILVFEKKKLAGIFSSSLAWGVLLGGALLTAAGFLSVYEYRTGMAASYLNPDLLWPYLAMLMGFFIITENVDSMRKSRFFLGNIILCSGIIVGIKLALGILK